MKAHYKSSAIMTIVVLALILMITGNAQARLWLRGGTTIYYAIDRVCTDGIELFMADSRSNEDALQVGLDVRRLSDEQLIFSQSISIPNEPFDVPGFGTMPHSAFYSFNWTTTLQPGDRVRINSNTFDPDHDVISMKSTVQNCSIKMPPRLPLRYLFARELDGDAQDVPPIASGGSPDCRPGIDVNRSAITIDENIIIDDLNFAMDLEHSSEPETLEATLTSPQGTEVTLIARNTPAKGFSYGTECRWDRTGQDGYLVGSDMADFVLDDESVFQLGDPNQAWENQDTAWQPTGPGSLADFYGENAKGTWTLDVCDIKPVVGHGYLSCWNLEVLDYRSVNFVQETYEVNESDGTATIEVELSETTAGPTEVTYTTVPASGSNQVVITDTLEFAPQTTGVPGDIKKSFTIPITDDGVDEADETVMIRLSSPTNDFFVADPGVAQLIIRDDDSQAATASLFVNVLGSGSVSRSPDKQKYEIGEKVTLTAEPGPGFYFEGWSGDLSGSQNPDQLTMDGDRTVLATFKPETVGGIEAYFLPAIIRP